MDFMDKKKKKKPKPIKKGVKEEAVFTVFRFNDAEGCTGGFSSETSFGRCILGNLYTALLKDGTAVVVKRGLSGARSYSSQLAASNELRILSALNSDTEKHSRHFARLIGFSTNKNETLLVLQLPNRGTLCDVLHRADRSCPPLSLPLRLHLAFQAALCVKVLHFRHKIAHLDIRSANFWVDRDWSVRLANFGVAEDIPWGDRMPRCPLGSMGMLDPGWPQEGYLAAKVDVFCFGLVLAEIVSNRKVLDVSKVPGDIAAWVLPVVGKNHVLAVQDPRLRMLPEHVRVPRDVGRIAAACLQPVARVRPTMSDVLERLRPLCQLFPFRTYV